MIRKLLIANRGEIAIRIIRAASEMGIRTVAVFSDADRNSPHAHLADEAVELGEPEATLSYLSADKIIAAAKATGADAIHPGYGFLSERAEFAERCEQEGIIFVGPPASAMRRLGAKIDAKQLAVECGVPITPGYFEPGATQKQLADAAMQIGYPVMLKASAGGGGRGMRIVCEPDQFAAEYLTATDEALKGFGDGAMMVEKLIDRPRHIEVQVLADGFGNVACLFERECSLQRRHQKLIEEAPSPAVVANPELWTQMQQAARALIQASGYKNAGTVEFMVDDAEQSFYFLEVNARLQVEHPVTEAITGVDLVQWQLRIASGEKLDLPAGLMSGDRAAIHGHAVEARIVAEDPAHGFLPSVGKLLAWSAPSGLGVRVDSGFVAGNDVSRYYDSMIAKVIAHGSTRAEAIHRLIRALGDMHVLGVKTNIEFIRDVLASDSVMQGKLDTGLLARDFGEWTPEIGIPFELGTILAAGSGFSAGAQPSANQARQSVWSLDDGYRNALGG